VKKRVVTRINWTDFTHFSVLRKGISNSCVDVIKYASSQNLNAAGTSTCSLEAPFKPPASVSRFDLSQWIYTSEKRKILASLPFAMSREVVKKLFFFHFPISLELICRLLGF